MSRQGELLGPKRLRDVSREAKIGELKRELAMRRRVYKDQVQRGRLGNEVAKERILILEAIIHDYVHGGEGTA